MNDLLKKAKEGAGDGKRFQGQVESLAHNRAEVSVLNVVFETTHQLPRKINQLRLDLLHVACAKQAHTPLTQYSKSLSSRCYCCQPYELGDGDMPALKAETMPVKQIEIERFTCETTGREAELNELAHIKRIQDMRERNRALIIELSQVVQELKDLESIFDGAAQISETDVTPKALSTGASIALQLGSTLKGP